MDVSRVRFNLGRTVTYHGAEYSFSAYILSVRNAAFYHQAELIDKRAAHSVIRCALSEVEEKEKIT